MKCLSPTCPGFELSKAKFTVRRLRGKKQQDETQPESIHVMLKCAYCGREIKVWISNEDLKKIYAILKLIQESIEFILKAIRGLKSKKSWFERILKKSLKFLPSFFELIIICELEKGINKSTRTILVLLSLTKF